MAARDEDNGRREARADPFLAQTPGVPAPGRGPADEKQPSRRDYHHPAAAWGAARSVARVIWRSREPVEAPRSVLKMNHPDRGFDCPGCAWGDDQRGLHLDICENGIKHVTWEMTRKKADAGFFAAHTVTELESWSDFALEDVGRLTEPLVYNSATDRYIPISWDEAFALVGSTLRGLASPDEASFYTSGRLANEATFLYQLWVRELGTNNLPDCSNMCHEATGRALTASLGTPKGTCDLADWEHADLIFVIGANAASNAPRMLTTLAEVCARGAEVVHVNPIVEAASGRTIVPHDFVKMATLRSEKTGTLNVQPRIAGDLAFIRGVAKAVFETADKRPDALDRAFLDEHTTGLEEYRRLCVETSWPELERQSGVDEATMRKVASLYVDASATIVAWCLGVTQQEHGVDTVREIANLLLLRGNVGRPGAGPSPIRGHSNVQGNRTCGIDHRPKKEFLDRLAEVCGIDPPREEGLDTVRTIEAMQRGEVKVFVGMGGNFVLAAPDTALTTEAMRRCELTVQVSTKLNRSHLVHGRQALILPCIGRAEKDHQRSGLQAVTVEDTTSMVHLSHGMKEPVSPTLRSEPAIIAGMAMASLPESRTPWQDHVDDYDRIRDTMARVIEGFDGFNEKVRVPHGFRIPQAAREREFHTASGRAEFSHAPLPDAVPPDGCLILGTMRSHDQWNTTIYSNNDRYRGVKNLRTLVFMSAADMAERGLAEMNLVDITSIARDGSRRTVHGYRALTYDIPPGNAAGYMPELNVLCPLGDLSEQSDQPLTKHLVVEIVPAEAR
jgi:molybdopterin-dependent oxidoreductase alpha subunit